MAVARVAARVQQGGHNVPEMTVRRRYESGLRNFFQVYTPVVDTWLPFDNSSRGGHKLIARQMAREDLFVANAQVWKTIREHYA